MTDADWLDELIREAGRRSAAADQARTADTKEQQLARLLERVTPDNMHGEISTGKPVGREVW